MKTVILMMFLLMLCMLSLGNVQTTSVLSPDSNLHPEVYPSDSHQE